MPTFVLFNKKLTKAKTYIISFAGLSVGRHDFEFKVDDSFFEGLDYSEIRKADVDVVLQLQKQSTMLILDFELKGTVNVPCDRCSEMFDQPISSKAQLIVKFDDEVSDDEDVVTLAHAETEIDVAQYLYEYISLALPYKRVHPNESDCNKEVLGKLKKMEAQAEEKTDTRWDKLKKLKV